MQKTQTQENTEKLLNFISVKFEGGQLNNESLVELIKHASDYLNLKTIPQYAKDNNMSYQGVKKFRDVREIAGTRFVVDNV